MTLHNITELYTEWFSYCTNITTIFRSTAIFKSSATQNNGFKKHVRFHCTEPHLPKCSGSRLVTEINININIQPPSTIVFLVFTKMVSLKLSILWRSFNIQNAMVPRWLVQDFNHLRTLNIRHFGMVKTNGLINMASRSPQKCDLLDFIQIH
jgi:hypothetical protein